MYSVLFLCPIVSHKSVPKDTRPLFLNIRAYFHPLFEAWFSNFETLCGWHVASYVVLCIEAGNDASPKMKEDKMNSIEKITNVTKKQVAEGFFTASQRIKTAARDMGERYYRRNDDGVNATDDMPQVPCPPAPEMPEALTAVISPETYGIRYVMPSQSADAISMHG